MSVFNPATSVELRNAIWRMFRNTADQDYLVSRWCAFGHLPYQFYWIGAQALEKYLKCALLLNGVSVKPYRHDIVSLFDKLRSTAQDALPWLFVPPRGFGLSREELLSIYPVVESYEQIVQRFAFQGHSDNRYRTFSLVTDMFDLTKLDELCFQIRSLCYPWELPYGPNGTPYLNFISSNPNFQPHLPLYGLQKAKSFADKERRKFARKMNFSFYPDTAYSRGKYLSTKSMENSVLFLETSRAGEASSVVKWLTENCQFSREVRQQINDYLSRF